ncbi:ATP synthase mitochondrial F1 complex assembly factor 2 [Chelonus insularis]|uniref:ATP synthase mitochondrial F1 complex assembly factor 2 n=1 Tax=Chelonus insularis TaxID=460826 RepID=UPI00158F5834|nr:ATP synthase mitochondrial F1 complex assembly factor 2 [Chelonus insularis]XP_034952119.1 ATP synthase mitochondrial F1 complex assembly factor 2 [Chelonus insularis]XP_034952120.1 ATP synthase mitochondrial F1 complex assembly factor 2 [Chelonus insularis]XP_034952121.1 ATP synthase mitochondrial F1 complex assembly factor 2 [Chelonus insularis]
MFRSFYHKFIPKVIIARNMATVKRFYRKTNIIQSGDKYEITLDQRKLKTPKGRVFEVSSRPLALAVALEWDSQEDTINRSNMHLTALCSTFLDNPQHLNKIDIVNYIINCLETDTILFQSDESEELYKLQVQRWDPIIQWFCDRYQVDIIKTKSISPPIIPANTKDILIRHISSFDSAALQGFMYGVDVLKSVILMLAVCDRYLNVEQAVSLSRLEEEFQISHWGNVEWSHELNKQDLQSRVAAAALFIYCNSTLVTTKPKLDNT